MESWRKINQSNFYQVSNLGRIRSINKTSNYRDGRIYFYKGKIRSPYVGKNGYPVIALSVETGKKKTFYIHRLVAENFIENPENKKEVNHINGNKLDNSIFNLEWVTPSENMQHAYDIGLKKFSGNKYIKYGKEI